MGAGVLLFEHFHRQSDQLKELTLLMLLTGNHARQLAIRAGIRGIEEAYLCGMFRNLGELSLACYFPDDYASVMARARETKCTLSEACERLVTISSASRNLGKAARAIRVNLRLIRVGFCMESPDLMVPAVQSDAERLRIISFLPVTRPSEITYRGDRKQQSRGLEGPAQ